MERDIRIGTVICRSVVGQTRENLERMRRWTVAAKDRGVELVCFPELNITGYCNLESVTAVSEPVPGPSTVETEAIARETGMTIIAGLAERGDDGRIYATQIVADETGLIGIYRKIHLGPPERTVFTPAETIPPLFSSRGLKFGVQLCYDAHFPELATHMALHGADAVFIPHASPGKSPEEKYRSWMRHLPARAFDNGIFVIAVNSVGDNARGLTFPGTAIILAPSGDVIASDTSDSETLLVADLTVETLGGVRNHKMRYFFPNRRPDLFDNHS